MAERRTFPLQTALAAELGELLSEARGDEPIREVAARLGVSHPSLLELEAGTANPTLARVAHVAEGYGLELRIVGTAVAPA